MHRSTPASRAARERRCACRMAATRSAGSLNSCSPSRALLTRPEPAEPVDEARLLLCLRAAAPDAGPPRAAETEAAEAAWREGGAAALTLAVSADSACAAEAVDAPLRRPGRAGKACALRGCAPMSANDAVREPRRERASEAAYGAARDLGRSRVGGGEAG